MLYQSSVLHGPSTPAPENVFLPFYLCPLERVRVVWVTPYPLPGVSLRHPGRPRSQGLGPGTERTDTPSDALRAILKDEGRTPPHGDLRAWAYQGVLFLSLSLTTPLAFGTGAIHDAFWAGVVKRACEHIQQRCPSAVFVCFGQRAAGVRAYLSGRARVLEVPDPLDRAYPGTQVLTRLGTLLSPPLDFAF
jgi:uracil-DNA glycosylase